MWSIFHKIPLPVANVGTIALIFFTRLQKVKIQKNLIMLMRIFCTILQWVFFPWMKNRKRIQSSWDGRHSQRYVCYRIPSVVGYPVGKLFLWNDIKMNIHDISLLPIAISWVNVSPYLILNRRGSALIFTCY